MKITAYKTVTSVGHTGTALTPELSQSVLFKAQLVALVKYDNGNAKIIISSPDGSRHTIVLSDILIDENEPIHGECAEANLQT